MRLAIFLAASALILAVPAQAKAPFLAKAKELKFTEITSCQSCHVDKMPKKGASEGNERGKYLSATKAAKKAAEVDLNWLKDYKGK
jgi:cytochrome c553